MLHVVHRYQPHWIARVVGNSACDIEREVGGLERRVSQDPFELWEKVVRKVGDSGLCYSLITLPRLGRRKE